MSGGAALDWQAIRSGSKSFAAASVLLDRRAREDAWALYAWCRYCDDVVDGQTYGGALSPVLVPSDPLPELRRLTVEAVEGGGAIPPPFEALRRAARSSGLETGLPLTLLDGFAMDVEGRTYETLEDTLEYAWRVAGVVGVMMARVMGVQDRATLERACDLGLALQLTNIARDVVEDARAGRVYLAGRWLSEAGVPPTAEAVSSQANAGAVARVVSRLLDEADRYYGSAVSGIGRLPLRRAWAIASARAVYREIGVQVRRREAAAWRERVSVSTSRKALLVAGAAATALTSRLRPATSRAGLWTMPG